MGHVAVTDFSASWCGPCKFIEPVIHAMAGKFDHVGFFKIDVDELSVAPMPTFVLLKEGKEIDRVIGAKKEELERKLKQHGGG
ncbi:unnamed protein product [Lupinus luteus]|uniref:Thioredoxin domain-containing protein n=1 Tax=Lupinus luteus TaxID=3873 RepID=A0AAV1WJ71_LUPLU